MRKRLFLLSHFNYSINYFINYSAKKSSQLFSRLFFGSKLDMSIILSIILSIIQQKSLVNYFHDYFTLQLFFWFFSIFLSIIQQKVFQLFSRLFFCQNWTFQLFFDSIFFQKTSIIDQRLLPNDVSPRSRSGGSPNRMT